MKKRRIHRSALKAENKERKKQTTPCSLTTTHSLVKRSTSAVSNPYEVATFEVLFLFFYSCLRYAIFCLYQHLLYLLGTKKTPHSVFFCAIRFVGLGPPNNTQQNNTAQNAPPPRHRANKWHKKTSSRDESVRDCNAKGSRAVAQQQHRQNRSFGTPQIAPPPLCLARASPRD